MRTHDLIVVVATPITTEEIEIENKKYARSLSLCVPYMRTIQIAISDEVDSIVRKDT